ncbi:MAG: hypothetical protein R3F59_28655 [Myxococcota bacterium]
MPAPLAAWLLACSAPGTLWGPEGRTELLTARYVLGAEDGQPALTILLSNGLFACSAPTWGADGVGGDLEAAEAAGCREGAQHLVLRVSDPDRRWEGTFGGGRVTGAYYAVREAVLADLHGLDRTYLAIDDLLVPELGPGTVTLDPALGPADLSCDEGVGRLRGELAFPEDGLSGRFVAEPCPCDDATTLTLRSSCVAHGCQRAGHDEGTGCR